MGVGELRANTALEKGLSSVPRPVRCVLGVIQSTRLHMVHGFKSLTYILDSQIPCIPVSFSGRDSEPQAGASSSE